MQPKPDEIDTSRIRVGPSKRELKYKLRKIKIKSGPKPVPPGRKKREKETEKLRLEKSGNQIGVE